MQPFKKLLKIPNRSKTVLKKKEQKKVKKLIIFNENKYFLARKMTKNLKKM